MSLLVLIAPACRKGDSDAAGRQMRAVSNALEQYARSHSGRLPSFDNLDRLQEQLLPYLMADGAKSPSFDGVNISLPLLARPGTHEPYVFNRAYSAAFDGDRQQADQIIVFYESKENSGGRLVAFLDGHHVWATSAVWEQLRKSGPCPLSTNQP